MEEDGRFSDEEIDLIEARTSERKPQLFYGKEKPSLDAKVARIERARARLNEVRRPDNTGRGRTLFRRDDRPDRRHALVKKKTKQI